MTREPIALSEVMRNPRYTITRSGMSENEIIPLKASRIILAEGYFVAPAARGGREYSTPHCRNPIHANMPRTKRSHSGIRRNASRARQLTESEIASILRNRNVGSPVEQAIEGTRRCSLEGGFTLAVDPGSIYDVTSVAPALDHGVDKFRRILQIGIEDHRGIPPRRRHTCGNGNLMAEIAAQVDDAEPGIVSCSLQ